MHRLGTYLGTMVLTGGLLLGGLALVPGDSANAAPKSTSTATNSQNPNPRRIPNQAGAAQPSEKHRVIHRALKQLHVVKAELERGSHDFGGHRVQAIQHVNEAIAELKLALQSDLASRK